MSRARELSRLGNPNIISADSDYNVGFGTLTPRAKGDFVGVVSATSFFGDGSTLSNIASAGIGTALSDDKTSPLNTLFYTNQTVRVGTSTEFNPPTSGNLGYSQAAEVEVADGADFTVGDGDVFMVDVLGITTDPLIGASVDNNYLFSTIYADNITNQAGTGAPDASQGFKISKTTESTNSLTGALIVSGGVGIAKSLHVGGNVSVGGTLTYEDVTNQDVLGIATYRSGVKFGVAGVGGTITGTGNATITGIVTASGFKGSGANLTALNAENISSGIVTSARLGGGSASASTYLQGDGQWGSISGGLTEIDKVGIFLNDNNNSRYRMYWNSGDQTQSMLFTPEMISARNTSETFGRMDAPVGSGISITAHIPLTSGQWNSGNPTINLEWKPEYAGVVRFPSTGTWKIDWQIWEQVSNNESYFSWEETNNLGTASTTWSVLYPNGWTNHNSNGTVAIGAGSFRNPGDYAIKAFDNNNTAMYDISRIVSVGNTSTYGMRYGWYRNNTGVRLFGDTTWTYTKLSGSTF